MRSSRQNSAAGFPGVRGAFSLVELWVVMAIIALLAAVGLPALRGFGRGTAMDAAARQMLSDLSMARRTAINGRTTVYMVFVPSNFVARFSGENDQRTLRRLTNLFGAQYSGYALLTARTVGDQPGRARARYVTEWRRLPEGVVIAPWKFDGSLPRSLAGGYEMEPFQYATHLDQRPFPFPSTEDPPVGEQILSLPYLAFNALGQVQSLRDEVITLVPGSVFVIKDASGRPVDVDVDFRKQQAYANTRITVRGLTGRAAVETVELK